MALPYKVWTDEDIKNRNVVDEGNYPFTILSVERKRTKVKLDDKGQAKPTYEMLQIEYQFHDKNGTGKTIRDWIVFMDGMDWKFRHLANTTGLLALYEAKTLDCQHLIGKQGVFALGIEETTYEGKTRKQNFVMDYVKKESDFLADDIPL
jgi:hypothetical protein